MLTALTLMAAAATSAQTVKTVLHAAAGPELITYLANPGAATLDKQASVALPENVQEAWPHPSRQWL